MKRFIYLMIISNILIELSFGTIGCGKMQEKTSVIVKKVQYQNTKDVLYTKGIVLEPAGNKLEIFVSQYDIRKVKEGQKAIVILGGREEIKSKAIVEKVSDRKEENGFSVILSIEEKKLYKIGMELSVQLYLKEWNHVFVVDDESVCKDQDGGEYVLVAEKTGENQRIEKKIISKLEQADNGKVLVSSEVKEGDLVVQNPNEISGEQGNVSMAEVKNEKEIGKKRKFVLEKRDMEQIVNFPGIVTENKEKQKEITGTIMQGDVSKVQIGMECCIWLNGDESFLGKLTFVSDKKEEDEKGYLCRIEIVDNEKEELNSGENVGIEVCVNKKKQVFSVPYDMIYGEDKKYVCKEDGTKIEVQTGCESEEYVEIKSEQLQEGMILSTEQ